MCFHFSKHMKKANTAHRHDKELFLESVCSESIHVCWYLQSNSWGWFSLQLLLRQMAHLEEDKLRVTYESLDFLNKYNNSFLKTIYLSVGERSKAQFSNKPRGKFTQRCWGKTNPAKLTNNSTLVCHQRGQSFNLIHGHIHAVSDTWKRKAEGPMKLDLITAITKSQLVTKALADISSTD